MLDLLANHELDVRLLQELQDEDDMQAFSDSWSVDSDGNWHDARERDGRALHDARMDALFIRDLPQRRVPDPDPAEWSRHRSTEFGSSVTEFQHFGPLPPLFGAPDREFY